MQQKREGKTIMEIRKITGVVPADKRAVEAAFDSIEPQPVACCNWPEQYPYAPEVSFRMFHTGAYLMLRFDVAERWTMARVTVDNGEVWTDSCVEFFVAPNPAKPPSGCYFHPRCRFAKDICKEKAPELREVRHDHWASCLFSEELTDGGI